MSAAPTLLSANRFSEIEASTPDFDALRERYDRVHQAIENAAHTSQALDAFAQWEQLRREFGTWASLTELHFQQDTNDARYKAAVDRLSELRPKVTGLDVTIKRALLASPLRNKLEARLGAHAFAHWALDVTAFDPVIEQDCVEESRLQDAYIELLAGVQLDFNGERLNLSSIGKYAENADRELRRKSYEAKWRFYAENRGRLDDLYDRLVRQRTGMARKLDLHNFIELGYRRMMRSDYGPAEVARYREEIVREIVPLAERIVQRQARDLGIDRVMFWDEHVFEKMPPPRPPASYDEMVTRARAAFDGIDPAIGRFASLMFDGDLVDLQARDGKAGGGFCTSFPTHGLPYIFANFNGTTGDVNVLVHEMGHAFQGYSSRTMPVMEYLWPTYEACEVHSMGMEFFAWPQLEQFFGDDAQRYRLQHLKSSLLFLPYGAAVDHFQHLVYEHPEASPQERFGFWKQVEAAYLPWRRYGGIEHLEAGGVWQAQRHIYLLPFYYIDYTLALCCALQFWAKSLDDYDSALDAYTTLCKRGGREAFQTLVRGVGLRSPFDSGVLSSVAERAASLLQL